MDNTFEAEWKRFSGSCIPPTAGDHQRQATEDAFYAGGTAMLDILTRLPDLPDDQAVQKMEALHGEVRKFAAKVLVRALMKGMQP